MSFDVEAELRAVERSVASTDVDGRAAHVVTLARCMATTAEDAWDAVTNAERIARWFLPVTGDLQFDGCYQLEGNAGGAITACEPPSHFALTWEFCGDVSWVEVRLSDGGDGRVRLTLAHTSLHSPHWDEFGPGATGVGWELGLMGLAAHLERPDEPQIDEAAFVASSEGRAVMAGSSEAWGRAAVAAGADPAVARAAAQRTTAFYTGEAS